jgi:glutamate/tyrosine decarboxylase-like PLP-dependent enzyme
MRTGIKTMARQALDQFVRPSLFYPSVSKHFFPNKSTSSLQIGAKLHGLESELKQRNIKHSFGSLYTPPHSQAVEVCKRFIQYNPGNLGNWSDDVGKTYATTQLEYEVIHNAINLYQGDQKKLSGYITSGATEGNIFSVWLGREYLEQYCESAKICLLKTSLTHYSVQKAGQLCNIPQFLIPLNKDKWNIDNQGLENCIQDLHGRGYRGFIISLTIGYTSTGTCDDINQITQRINKSRRTLKGSKFFLWIDAALNGLITPFLDKDFHPFKSSHIKTLVVDFHKFGLVPYSAGIVLYQRKLKKLIEKPIDYLSETDATLLGSRSGIPAVSIWTMMHSLGKTGYTKLAKEQGELKNYFIKKIKLISPATEVLTHPQSLSCGLILHGLKDARLPNFIEDKYDLHPAVTQLFFYPKEKKQQVIYKCFFLPHIKKEVIDEFIIDLLNLK